jgi:hypothetical protein
MVLTMLKPDNLRGWPVFYKHWPTVQDNLVLHWSYVRLNHVLALHIRTAVDTQNHYIAPRICPSMSGLIT